jgi:nucleoid DNA-binding protein
MNRSDFVERLWTNSQLPRRDVYLAVNTMLEHTIETLATGERVELQEFGSFSLRYRAAQVRRNPETGNGGESYFHCHLGTFLRRFLYLCWNRAESKSKRMS